MITIASDVRGKKVPHEFFGLSKDEKPIDKYNGVKVTNGSVFTEIDTKKIYMFDEEKQAWIEQEVQIGSTKPGTVFSVQTAKEEEIKNQLDIMMKPTEITGKANLFSLNQMLVVIANKIKCIPIESYYSSPVGTSCKIKFVTKNVRVGFISNDNNEKSLVVKHTKTTGYIQSTTLKPGEVLKDVWFLDVANIELKFADNTAFNDDVRYSLECY